jgi:ribonuclease Y
MKGRIIGREGRNIRTLEHLTGVDVIVDDTPQAVVLSSFDPIRREIAKMTLLKLVEDGRIQPARIEEMYYQSKAEIDEHILQAGEQAVFEANAGEFHEEVVKLLGRLNYRTSYGPERPQAHARGRSPRRPDGDRARSECQDRRSGRRSCTTSARPSRTRSRAPTRRSRRSTPAATGKRPGVIHASRRITTKVQPQTVEAVLLIAADAISGARPGARGDSLENYIKRLEALEELAAKKAGVEKVYALQAGREIRVMVKPARSTTTRLRSSRTRSRATSSTSSSTPGQIKVTVIRESRSTEFAK